VFFKLEYLSGPEKYYFEASWDETRLLENSSARGIRSAESMACSKTAGSSKLDFCRSEAGCIRFWVQSPCALYLRSVCVATMALRGLRCHTAWKMAARDQWIGWNAEQRVRNLQLIVNQSRFLMLPWVRVKGLASKILAQSARQLPADWECRYGYRPLLLETLVSGCTAFPRDLLSSCQLDPRGTNARPREDGPRTPSSGPGHQRHLPLSIASRCVTRTLPQHSSGSVIETGPPSRKLLRACRDPRQ
jgi:hypothetical protein